MQLVKCVWIRSLSSLSTKRDDKDDEDICTEESWYVHEKDNHVKTEILGGGGDAGRISGNFKTQ